MTDRVQRGCDVCGGVDDHPRHVTYVREGGVPDQALIDKLIDNGARGVTLAEVLDPSTVCRHMDCCADQGCDVCKGVLDGVSARGADLVAHLTKGI